MAEEKNSKNPINDSLWMRCFWEIAEKDKANGKDKIVFADVDALVLERSKMEIKDLITYLKSN